MKLENEQRHWQLFCHHLVQYNKQHHRKVLLKSSHLKDVVTLHWGFHLQAQKYVT